MEAPGASCRRVVAVSWRLGQTANTSAYNYVTATSSAAGSRISLSYGKTAGQRPWFRALTAHLHGGYLRERSTRAFSNDPRAPPIGPSISTSSTGW